MLILCNGFRYEADGGVAVSDRFGVGLFGTSRGGAVRLHGWRECDFEAVCFSTFHIYVCDEIGIVSSVVRNGCFTERVLNAMVVAVGRKSIGKTHGGRSVLLLLGSFWGEGFQVRVGLVLGML